MSNCQTFNVYLLNTSHLHSKHVYKVVAEMCLEKCLIPKHSFYSVLNILKAYILDHGKVNHD